MKQLTPRTWPVLILLLVALPISAQDAGPADPENAPTPTNLLELLPEGGLGEGLDFWLIMDSPFDEGGMYMNWSIKPEGDATVFTMRQGSADVDGFSNTERITFGPDGKLVSFHATTRWGGDGGSVSTGSVVDDRLVITTRNKFADVEPGLDGGKQTHEVDLSTFDDRVASSWMPLVFAYHIREGSLGYRVKMFEVQHGSEGGTMIVEDTGAEQIEVAGEARQAHILLITVEPPEDEGFGPDGDMSMQMTVLDDGTIYAMAMKDGEMAMSARHATAEQVAEQFNFDEAERADDAVEEE